MLFQLHQRIQVHVILVGTSVIHGVCQAIGNVSREELYSANTNLVSCVLFQGM